MVRKQSQFVLLLTANICVTVLVLCIGAIGIARQVGAYHDLQTKHAAINEQQQKIDADLKQRDQREEDLRTLEAKLASLDENLVDYKFIPTFLQQIQTTSGETGNVLQNLQPRDPRPLDLDSSPLLKQMKPDKPEAPKAAGSDTDAAGNNPDDTAPKKEIKKAKSPYQVQQLSMDIVGSYVSAMQFLDALRQFRKMLYIRTITLNPRQQSAANASLSTHIEADLIIIPNQFRPRTNEDAEGTAGGG